MFVQFLVAVVFVGFATAIFVQRLAAIAFFRLRPCLVVSSLGGTYVSSALSLSNFLYLLGGLGGSRSHPSAIYVCPIQLFL
jgi:hypothetical protein